MKNEIFESSVRTAGDLAGVFEYDGEESYFFLFDLTKDKGKQASGVIWLNSAVADFGASDVSIKWNQSEDIVELYIRGNLCAALDQQGKRFGGHYGAAEAPGVPERGPVAIASCDRV